MHSSISDFSQYTNSKSILGLWCHIVFCISNSFLECFESNLVMRNHWSRKIIDIKPSDFCHEVWFENLRSLFPTLDKTIIVELDSLYSTRHHDSLGFDWDFCDNPDFFVCLSECTFTKKFSFFYFSSRKSPVSWPCIDRLWTLDEQDMWAMFADDMSCCGEKSTRHSSRMVG